ncbi:hypothetical protein [Vulcanisaeta thermophila]|uniref:hypothetical protein n=1 Tax=Vulcanisaeta thermophila TaxID=867917 RepID=UPI0008534743|nr:hypothetical protein [Vulcanisaeta thermophila]
MSATNNGARRRLDALKRISNALMHRRFEFNEDEHDKYTCPYCGMPTLSLNDHGEWVCKHCGTVVREAMDYEVDTKAGVINRLGGYRALNRTVNNVVGGVMEIGVRNPPDKYEAVLNILREYLSSAADIYILKNLAKAAIKCDANASLLAKALACIINGRFGKRSSCIVVHRVNDGAIEEELRIRGLDTFRELNEWARAIGEELGVRLLSIIELAIYIVTRSEVAIMEYRRSRGNNIRQNIMRARYIMKKYVNASIV